VWGVGSRLPLASPFLSPPSCSRRPSASSAAPASLNQAQQRRFRIYTKTGDGGSSSLYNGERRRKDDEFFEALGDVDELNGVIGLAREHLRVEGERGRAGASALSAASSASSSSSSSSPSGPAAATTAAASSASSPAPYHLLGPLESHLQEIQSRLLDVGSAIATPRASSRPDQLERVAFSPDHTRSLEEWIDAMDEQLPPLKNFILPVRGGASSHCPQSQSHNTLNIISGNVSRCWSMKE
jgi:cob(I)alamin adenosyltransferase